MDWNNYLRDELSRIEKLSGSEQLRQIGGFLGKLEQAAGADEGSITRDLSESSILNLLSPLNTSQRETAKTMLVSKFVPKIDLANAFINCLRELQRKFPMESRIPSLINRMTKINQHFAMLKRTLENY